MLKRFHRFDFVFADDGVLGQYLLFWEPWVGCLLLEIVCVCYLNCGVNFCLGLCV